MGDFCVLKLRDIQTLDQAEEYVGQEMVLPEKDLQPLGKDLYYIYQLSECSVITRTGEKIGTVKDMMFIKGNDLLVVEKGGREIYIPFAESICVEVNLERKEIVIDPPEGLLELDEI